MNGKLNTGDRLISAKQLLEQLFEDGARPSLNWAYESAKTRVLPSYRVGGLIRFSLPEVRAAIKQQAVAERRSV